MKKTAVDTDADGVNIHSTRGLMKVPWAELAGLIGELQDKLLEHEIQSCDNVPSHEQKTSATENRDR